jgi:hypothetical protein
MFITFHVGDSSLSARGRQFGACLARFMHEQKSVLRQRQLEKYRAEMANSSVNSLSEPPEKSFTVWTSLLKGTIETVEKFDLKEFKIMVCNLSSVVLIRRSRSDAGQVVKRRKFERRTT